MSDPAHMVTTAPQLANVVKAAARERRIALDTEANGFHRYPERVCLLQLAMRDRVYIIDPMAIDDVSSLGAPLADPRVEKVMHGADYDVRSLDREWGFRIRNLYDTGVAARFCGIERLGLGSVMEELMGRTLPKEKRLQRADWSIRPISEEALAYAAGDVRYLFELREELGKRLEALGRTEWVAEECARLSEVRYKPPDLETAFLSMKGAGKLDGTGLALLRRLVSFRDTEARKQGRPPFRILSDKTLLHLAEHPEEALEDAPGIGDYGLRRYGRGLKRALAQGRDDPQYHRPKQPRERVSSQEQQRRQDRLKELKAWRSEQGVALKLDPPSLWPTASLERLAKAPETLEAETVCDEVRVWQRRHVAPSLRAWAGEHLQP